MKNQYKGISSYWFYPIAFQILVGREVQDRFQANIDPAYMLQTDRSIAKKRNLKWVSIGKTTDDSIDKNLSNL